MRLPVILTWFCMLLVIGTHGRAEEFARKSALGETERAVAAMERVKGLSEALLVVPAADSLRPATDPRDGLVYHAACYAEVAENGLFIRRFAVHVPEEQFLPFAKRAARFLALLWGAANQRFGTLSRRLRQQVVDVWLTRSGKAGGEQFRNNLYIYDVLSERSGIEWARELAHEYGHYLLPAPSGYTEPESWANGVLGERLFLKWLRDDLLAGRLEPAEVPFVTLADLQDYCTKQVTPLIDHMCEEGPNAALLVGTDRRAMNAFTGLMLYIDETYGPTLLLNMLDYLPRDHTERARGQDFLSAFQSWLDNAPNVTIRLPGEKAVMLYLPAGTYRLRAGGASLRKPAIGRGVTVAREGEGWRVSVPSPGWRAIRIFETGAILRWERLESPRRRGAEENR